MNILFLTHTFPYPLNDGVRLHVYHILRELARRHRIFLLALNDAPVREEDRREIEGIGVRIVEALEHRVPQGFLSRLSNTLFDRVPFFVRQFESDAVRLALRRFLAGQPIDLVHVDYLSMAIYKNEFANLPAVFFPHDAVSMLFERNIRSETNFFRKAYTFFQWKKVRRFETEWIARFDGTMVVSPVDREYLLRHCPRGLIAVSPNGVDADYFSPQPRAEEADAVLFRGVMNFLPNSDAVRFFYQEVLPEIWKENPRVKFYAVGNAPPPDLLEAASREPRLVLAGYVDDMRDWMARAPVIVCPMRIGSGIKNKILESMAMAKPVVCTRLACAGLQLVNGRHLAAEDDPKAMAKKVLELLRDPALRKKMGAEAREFVRAQYTWKKNADDFEALYRQAIRKPPAPAGKR